MITVRKTIYADLAGIRKLRLQLTGKSASDILHKQWRILVLEAQVTALVLMDDGFIIGFLAMRRQPTTSYGMLMSMTHFAVNDSADAVTLLAEAEALAIQLDAQGMIVQNGNYSPAAASFYRSNGFRFSYDTWIKNFQLNPTGPDVTVPQGSERSVLYAS